MLKAIIFDFDGVIVDTELDRFKFIQKELLKYRIIIDDSAFSLFLGKKTAYVIKELIPSIEPDILTEINNKRQKQIEDNIIELKPMPKIDEILELLSKRYLLAITTGSNQVVVNKFLEYHNLKRYFSVITTGEQFKSSKPDPECYNMTLRKLNVEPSESIIIEDSQAGIEAGKNMNCIVFGLKNRHNINQLRKADKIFSDYKEMLKYFASLKQ